MYPKVKKLIKGGSNKNRVLSIWFFATVYGKIESCYVSNADTLEIHSRFNVDLVLRNSIVSIISGSRQAASGQRRYLELPTLYFS